MLGVRYNYVRSILAIITVALLAAGVFLARDAVSFFLLMVLVVISAMSWINPPGVYGWLVQGVCPFCHGHVVWEIQQEPEPYNEVITARCEDCGRRKVEFAYQPR